VGWAEPGPNAWAGLSPAKKEKGIVDHPPLFTCSVNNGG